MQRRARGIDLRREMHANAERLALDELMVLIAGGIEGHHVRVEYLGPMDLGL